MKSPPLPVSYYERKFHSRIISLAIFALIQSVKQSSVCHCKRCATLYSSLSFFLKLPQSRRKLRVTRSPNQQANNSPTLSPSVLPFSSPSTSKTLRSLTAFYDDFSSPLSSFSTRSLLFFVLFFCRESRRKNNQKICATIKKKYRTHKLIAPFTLPLFLFLFPKKENNKVFTFFLLLFCN